MQPHCATLVGGTAGCTVKAFLAADAVTRGEAQSSFIGPAIFQKLTDHLSICPGKNVLAPGWSEWLATLRIATFRASKNSKADGLGWERVALRRDFGNQTIKLFTLHADINPRWVSYQILCTQGKNGAWA